MKSIWDLRSLKWKGFGKGLWQEFNDDRVLAQSAQLSFYFVLSVFPLLLFLTALLGFFLKSEAVLYEALQKYFRTVAPDSISDLLDATLHEISTGSSGGKLSLGLIATLWAASNGMVAVIDALNIVYDVGEARTWWKRRLVALLLTGVFLVLIFTALLLLLYGSQLIEWTASQFGFGRVFTVLWTILEWLLVLGLVVLVFNILYVYAPNIKHHDWHWLMPGTVVGVALWLLVSFGFKLYLQFFNRYSVTYGSIGAVIILLLWFYFTGIAILVGAEVNAKLEKLSGRTPQPKATST